MVKHINLWKLRHLLQNNNDCVKFVIRNLQMLPDTKRCKKCNKLMQCYVHKRNVSFRCCKKQSHANKKEYKESIYINTIFENTKITLQQHVLLLYCFTWEYKYKQIINECSITDQHFISSATVSQYNNLYREAMHYGLCNKQSEGKLGGDTKIVEVDETLISSRKFNRGRRVEGYWLLGMTERNSGNIRFVTCPKNKRDQNTLIAIIKENVETGTTILTDLWKGYNLLKKSGYTHKTVNHSTNFINPFDGTHTQNIESNWSALKRKLRTFNKKDNFDLYLIEYMYRKYCSFNNVNILLELAKDITDMYRYDE